MPQCAARIVVPGTPMLLHAEPREFVVLGVALVVLCPIDQMNDVVNLAFGDSTEQPRFRTVLKLFFAMVSPRFQAGFSMVSDGFAFVCSLFGHGPSETIKSLMISMAKPSETIERQNNGFSVEIITVLVVSPGFAASART
jgi:hypothetical protein